MAIDHAADIGARLELTPFQVKEKTDDLVAELNANKYATISMTRTMMHYLFTIKDDPKSPQLTMLKKFIASTGVRSITLILDEAEDLYKTPSGFPKTLDKVNKELEQLTIADDQEEKIKVNLTVIGLTATPGFDRKQYRVGALKLFLCSDIPKPLEYTTEELNALWADTKKLPNHPKSWQTIDVASPVDDPRCAVLLQDMRGLIVKVLFPPFDLTIENGKISARGKLDRKLAQILVT